MHRTYSAEDIYNMRNALRAILPRDSQSHVEYCNEIEEQLRTYCSFDVEPDELVKLAALKSRVEGLAA